MLLIHEPPVAFQTRCLDDVAGFCVDVLTADCIIDAHRAAVGGIRFRRVVARRIGSADFGRADRAAGVRTEIGAILCLFDRRAHGGEFTVHAEARAITPGCRAEGHKPHRKQVPQ